MGRAVARIIGGLGTGATANTVLNAYRQSRPRLPEAPTWEMLDTTADFGFEFARQLDVDYDGNAFAQGLIQAQDNLYQRGTRDFLAPRAYRVMEQMRERAKAERSTSRIFMLTAGFGDCGERLHQPPPNKRRPCKRLPISTFHPQPRPSDRASRRCRCSGGHLGRRNGQLRRGDGSQRLQRAEEKVDLQSAATHSGLNIDNKFRQKAAWIVDPEFPARRAGLSEAEVAMLTDVAMGQQGSERSSLCVQSLGWWWRLGSGNNQPCGRPGCSAFHP